MPYAMPLRLPASASGIRRRQMCRPCSPVSRSIWDTSVRRKATGISQRPPNFSPLPPYASSSMRREEEPGYDILTCAHGAARPGVLYGTSLPPETRQSANDRELPRHVPPLVHLHQRDGRDRTLNAACDRSRCPAGAAVSGLFGASPRQCGALAQHSVVGPCTCWLRIMITDGPVALETDMGIGKSVRPGKAGQRGLE